MSENEGRVEYTLDNPPPEEIQVLRETTPYEEEEYVFLHRVGDDLWLWSSSRSRVNDPLVYATGWRDRVSETTSTLIEAE